jgi:regulator of replication initiation timing
MADGLEWLICDEPCKVMDTRSGCHCARARDEIVRLRERMEIDPRHPYDGVDCRDETIRGQDAEIASLKAKIAELKDGIAQLQEIVNSDASEEERLRAENASLKAEVARKDAALKKAESGFYNMANAIDDEDYRGSVPGIDGIVVGHREHYHKGHVQWLVKYAEQARAAINPSQEKTDPHIQSSITISGAEYVEMKAQIDSLKADLAFQTEARLADGRDHMAKMAEMVEKITRLKAEVGRMREFVLFVDKWTNYKPNKPHQPTSYENCVKTIAPMAAEFRAALTPSQEPRT